MSQHHHHDNKGHHHQHDESPQSNGWKPGRHNWVYYAAAVLVIVSMVLYLLTADLRLRPAPPVTPPANGSGN